MSVLSIAYFSTSSLLGQQLEQQVQILANSLNFSLHSLQASNPIEYQQACVAYDIVILDGSIETNASHNFDFAIPVLTDFVLVFSRGLLPLNFASTRESYTVEKKDAAGQIIERKVLHNSSLFSTKKELSNPDILEWLEAQLQDLKILFKEHPKRMAEQKKFVAQPWSSILKLTTGVGASKIINSLDNASAIKKRSGQIFISFRNNEKLQVAQKLEKLKKLIETKQFPEVEAKSVLFYPPNSIASEIMSEQRRWQILAMLERFFSQAEEFWIYETEDYYNSWWTLGELMALRYRQGLKGNSKIPKIRIFKPDDNLPEGGRLIDAPDRFLPDMSEQQRNRIARWYVNSDPSQMAPESVLAMRTYAKLPFIGKMSYLQDHVWTREFWEVPILDCVGCRKIGVRKNKFNVEDFIWTQGEWFTRLSNINSGEITHPLDIKCPNCGEKYRLNLSASHYFWIPPTRRELVAQYYRQIYNVQKNDGEGDALVRVPTLLVEKMR